MENKEFDALKAQALEQLMSGKSLFREGGALAPLLKEVLDAALEAEMESHLGPSERIQRNKRNVHKTKTVKNVSWTN